LNNAAEQWDALAQQEEERTNPNHWDYSPSARARADLYRKTAQELRAEEPTLFSTEEAGRLFDERMEAEREQQREDLEAEMRKPLGSISDAAGGMERDSPLFYGTGSNPTLF
jgi:hypothetical protein